MNLLLHHVRKDLRHSRWLIALTLLVAACVLWLPATPIEERVGAFEWLSFVRYGSWAMLFLTIGRIVQLDAPMRDTAFLRSRPVSSNEWLASKLASGVILMLPLALLQVAMILLAGLQPEFIDLLLIFAEEMLVLAVVVALAMAMAARSKTYSNFISAAMGIALASFIVFAVYINAAEWLTRGTKSEWGHDTEYLKLSRLLITQAIAVLCLVVGLLGCIRARRPERLAPVISGTALVAALAWFFWPLNFVKTFTRPEAAAPRSEWPDLSSLRFSFREQRSWSVAKAGPVLTRFSFGDGGNNGTIYRRINGYTQLDGLPEKWFAYPNSFDSALTLSNGKTLLSRYVAWAGLSETMALPMVGIPLTWDKSANPLGGVVLAEFPLPEASDAMSGAKLQGEAHIPLKHPVILARMPLRKGASTKIGNRHIRITEVERLDTKIHYKLAIETARVRFRGGWNSEPHRRIEFLAVNVGKREFLTLASNAGYGGSSGHYSLEGQDISQTIWRDPMEKWDGSPIPDNWLDDSELLVVGDQYGGKFSQSFDFSDVNLSNP